MPIWTKIVRSLFGIGVSGDVIKTLMELRLTWIWGIAEPCECPHRDRRWLLAQWIKWLLLHRHEDLSLCPQTSQKLGVSAQVYTHSVDSAWR